MKKLKIIAKALNLSIKTKTKISLIASVLGFGVALLPSYISIVLGGFTNMLYDAYSKVEKGYNSIILNFLLLAFLVLLQKTYAFLQGYLVANDSICTNHYIRKKTMEIRCSVKYKYVENFDGFNDKISFVNTYTGYRVASSVQTIILWLQNLLSFIFAVNVLVKVDYRIVLLLLVTAIPAAILCYIQKDEDYRHNAKWMMEGELVIHYFFICVGESAMEEIRHLKIYDYLKARWKSISEQYIEKKNNLTRKYVLYNSVADILRNVVYIFVLLIVVKGIFLDGKYNLGVFILVYSVSLQLQNITMRMVVQIASFFADIKYMENYFELESLPYEAMDMAVEGCKNPEIEFENVSFIYPGSKDYAVQSINLRVHPGEKIAIVGENGSGKTTFINLLCGIYEPTEGVVKMNSMDIKEQMPKLRKTVSVVFQDFGKYDGTLLENITISDSQKKEDREFIHNMAQIIKANEMILLQEKGLDTDIGLLSENSNNISGGQWQKVAILRALYKKQASIMILDEPTAALDPISETDLYKNFKEITGKKTTILISHRLGVASIVDRILVFNNGKIIEDGTHEELMKLNGKYKELFISQAQWYA